MDPTKPYCIFPENPGEVRRVGKFEFSNLGPDKPRFVGATVYNFYSWKYIPEPGEPPTNYIKARDKYVYHGYDNPDASRPRPVHITYSIKEIEGDPTRFSNYNIDAQHVREELRKAYKEDFQLWKKLRYKIQTEEQRVLAEAKGLTLSAYRKELSDKKLRKKTIENTSEKMEVSKYLVDIKDEIENILNMMEKPESYSLKTICLLRRKIEGFSGPLYIKAKKIAQKKKKA